MSLRPYLPTPRVLPRLWRRLLPLLLLLPTSRAAAQSLWEAELRFGYGIAIATDPSDAEVAPSKTETDGTVMDTTPAAPMTITALGAIAINEEPALSAYGGLVVELRDDTAVGATGGVRLNPGGGPLRLAAGASYLHAPRSMWGATASAGACVRVASMLRTCGDLQLTAYVAGAALADGETLTQIQAVLGVVFDSL